MLGGTSPRMIALRLHMSRRHECGSWLRMHTPATKLGPKQHQKAYGGLWTAGSRWHDWCSTPKMPGASAALAAAFMSTRRLPKCCEFGPQSQRCRRNGQVTTFDSRATWPQAAGAQRGGGAKPQRSRQPAALSNVTTLGPMRTDVLLDDVPTPKVDSTGADPHAIPTLRVVGGCCGRRPP